MAQNRTHASPDTTRRRRCFAIPREEPPDVRVQLPAAHVKQSRRKSVTESISFVVLLVARQWSSVIPDDSESSSPLEGLTGGQGILGPGAHRPAAVHDPLP